MFAIIKCPKTRARGHRAQSIIEVLVGIMVLVPIALALLDLGCVVIAGNIAGNLAKQAARAAGSSTSQALANAALQDTLKQFPASPIIKNPQLQLTTYDTTTAIVTVKANVDVGLPVPLPFINGGGPVKIQTQASEPLVSQPVQ